MNTSVKCPHQSVLTIYEKYVFHFFFVIFRFRTQSEKHSYCQFGTNVAGKNLEVGVRKRMLATYLYMGLPVMRDLQDCVSACVKRLKTSEGCVYTNTAFFFLFFFF